MLQSLPEVGLIAFDSIFVVGGLKIAPQKPMPIIKSTVQPLCLGGIPARGLIFGEGIEIREGFSCHRTKMSRYQV